jgi:hypothetical protein
MKSFNPIRGCLYLPGINLNDYDFSPLPPFAADTRKPKRRDPNRNVSVGRMAHSPKLRGVSASPRSVLKNPAQLPHDSPNTNLEH